MASESKQTRYARRTPSAVVVLRAPARLCAMAPTRARDLGERPAGTRVVAVRRGRARRSIEPNMGVCSSSLMARSSESDHMVALHLAVAYEISMALGLPCGGEDPRLRGE